MYSCNTITSNDKNKHIMRLTYNKTKNLVTKISTFNDSVLDGTSIYFNSEGSIEKIESYTNGIKDGEFFYFDKNAFLTEKFQYKMGNIEGVSYSFYPSGIRKSEKYWHKNIQIYLAKDFYDTTGNLKIMYYYNNSGKCYYRGFWDRSFKKIKDEGNINDTL